MNRLRTPEDIQNLSGYIPKVDPVINPLNRIITHYFIRPFAIKCSLCGVEHMEGCIVELADHQLTNIGHICGKRFGESFYRERTKNYEADNKPRLIQSISHAQSLLASEQFKHDATSLAANDLVYRREGFVRMFPGLMEILRRRAAGNVSEVTEALERSKDEIDDLMAANPFQSREALGFREKRIGAVAGFRFPTYDWSMSSGLRKLFSDLSKFHESKPRTLGMSDLQRWANWAEDFDGAISKLRSAVEDGNRFFTEANFRLFATLAPADTTKAQLQSLKVKDIRTAPLPAPQHLQRPVSTGRLKHKAHISAKQLRRITGNKMGC